MNNCKVLLLWAVVVWFYGPVWGQEDSLKQELLSVNNDTLKAKILDDLAWVYIYDNPLKARVYADSSYRLLINSQDELGASSALNTIANTFLVEGKMDSALTLYNQALILAKPNGSPKQIGTLYNNIGIVHFNKGQIDTAIALYRKGLEYRERSKDTSQIIASCINLGGALHEGGNSEQGVKVLLLAVDLSKRVSDFTNLAISYANLNTVYIDLDEWEQALEYGRFAQQYFEANDNKYRLSPLYGNFGAIFNNLGEPDSAVFYLSKALKINDFDPYTRAYTLHNLGDTQISEGNDSAALRYYLQAMDLEQELGMSRELINSKVSVGNILGKMGQYQQAQPYLRDAISATDTLNGMWEDRSKALKFLLLTESYLQENKEMSKLINAYSEATDSLYNWLKFEAITEIETRYQTEQKELQNQALQRENNLQAQINRNQRLGLGGLSLGLIALAGLSIFLYRQRQRIQAQKSEIELLHREQRHRMMNNLVFANSLMSLQVNRLKEQPEAQQAVKEADARLRAMSVLQSRLHHDGEGQKTVAIREYLEEITTALQRSFGSPEQPLRIHLHAPDAERVDGEAAMRIALIVNELATNSCKHAFAEQPNPEITVALQPETEGRYRLIYTDNGSGLPADFQVDTKQSMGLFLLHNLVKQLNGRIAFSGEKGTRVECELNLKAA